MDPVLLATSAAAVVVVVLVALLLAGARRGSLRRRDLEAELARARADIEALQERVDRLDRGSHPRTTTTGREPASADASEYLITSLATSRSDAGADVAADAAATRTSGSALTGGEFLDVALGESLVRVAALLHGVRRAASPENRNRIRFEMAREVKRARRQRRRDLKDARRDLQRRQAGSAGLAEDAA
jgi:hypothetical protein